MAVWPAGYDRIVLDIVDSTNAEAARRATDGPVWVLAHAQSSGRGRRGRAWAMPPGSFAASLAWRPEGDPAALALRSFVASLALRDALAALGAEGLSLKWPNDVLLEGGKLAGILLESPERGLLVLGIGVNLITAPDPASVEQGALRPVSLLEATGLRVTPEAMLDALASAFEAREAQFATWGFAPIRADWLRHAARLGEPMVARMPDRSVTGVFEDVGADGHLVLRTAHGRERITAADIFFGPVPTGEALRCS